jgi:hypothetical protein
VRRIYASGFCDAHSKRCLWKEWHTFTEKDRVIYFKKADLLLELQKGNNEVLSFLLVYWWHVVGFCIIANFEITSIIIREHMF